MAQPWAKPFYNTRAWIKTRELYIQNRMMFDGGMCEECHRNPGHLVHHRIALTEENIKDLNVSLNFENLELVCKKCHDSFEGHGAGGHGKAKAICIFDENGEPISLREIDRESAATDRLDRPGRPPVFNSFSQAERPTPQHCATRTHT